ncbi:class I glutamine amidotransferase-like protein [Auriculariales sp. MPI-PUGE-AT-0066]|nr:class I glutamine amidotransferase-like protein [Auriculariales sp. MPI-PUGE-AT-0066]
MLLHQFAFLSAVAASAVAQATAADIKHIGYILLPAMEVLDFFGPLSVLNMLANSAAPMNLSIISLTKDPVTTKLLSPPATGSVFYQTIVPSHSLADPPKDLDVLIVPGGPGTRAPIADLQPYYDFIASEYPKLKYLISVCTGVTFLARAGVLDGKRATGNKFAWEFVTSTGPNVNWVPEARWVVDGNIWTSSGVAAGMDAIFGWVRELWGEERAARIANILEYERHTDPSWDPFAGIWNATWPLTPTSSTATTTATTSVTTTDPTTVPAVS